MFHASYYRDRQDYRNRQWTMSGQMNGPAIVQNYFLRHANRPALLTPREGDYNQEGGEDWRSSWLWPRGAILNEKNIDLVVRALFFEGMEGWEWDTVEHEDTNNGPSRRIATDSGQQTHGAKRGRKPGSKDKQKRTRGRRSQEEDGADKENDIQQNTSIGAVTVEEEAVVSGEHPTMVEEPATEEVSNDQTDVFVQMLAQANVFV